MSFTCQVTGNHIDGKPRRVITETREKIYPPRYKIIDGAQRCIDNGGHGVEIAKELLVDPAINFHPVVKHHRLEDPRRMGRF